MIARPAMVLAIAAALVASVASAATAGIVLNETGSSLLYPLFALRAPD